MQYDEYTPDIPENRLIKSCLKFLLFHSHEKENKKKIFQYLTYFGEIPESRNYEKDFLKCQKGNRLFKRYKQLILWCKIFLKSKTFSVFNEQNKNEVAISLLFPMEKVFEAYVGWCLKNYLLDYEIKEQESKYFLCKEDKDKGIFKLRPDFVLTSKEKEKTILDAKWKKIDKKQDAKYEEGESKYNLSQADLYQMLAYYQVYNQEENLSDKVFLIFPKNNNFTEKIEFIFNTKDNNPTCICYPFDLSSKKATKESTEKLLPS